MPPPCLPCPVCRKPATARVAPFCSVRCADIDLGRWFNEAYRIAIPLPEGPNTEDDNLTA